jgi:hypothetical protein
VLQACVDSLASAFKLLDVAYPSTTNLYASPWVAMVVRLWGVLFQLMQDENEDIRIAASALAWSTVRSKEQMQPLVRNGVWSPLVLNPDTNARVLHDRPVLFASKLRSIWPQIFCTRI